MKVFTHALLIALLSTSAFAEDTAKSTEAPKTTDTAKTAKKEKLTPTELQVMAHYHGVNQLEIDLGKVAMKNGGSQAVKSYGEMMVKQHGEDDKQLKDLAKRTGQTIPAEKAPTEAEKQDEADTKKQAAAIKKLKGADFDRQYIQMMVDGHDKQLSMIDSKIGEVQNTELADMLKNNVKPMLQHHADAAREIQKSNAQASKSPNETTKTPVAKAPGAK